MGEGVKGALVLAVVAAVLALGGMVATTLQDRAEARLAEAEATQAEASAREEDLAAERRAEDRVLALTGGEPPTLGQLRHEAAEAAEELSERTAEEEAWRAGRAEELREGDGATTRRAEYYRRLVAVAEKERELALARVAAVEAHGQMLEAEEGSGS